MIFAGIFGKIKISGYEFPGSVIEDGRVVVNAEEGIRKPVRFVVIPEIFLEEVAQFIAEKAGCVMLFRQLFELKKKALTSSGCSSLIILRGFSK